MPDILDRLESISTREEATQWCADASIEIKRLRALLKQHEDRWKPMTTAPRDGSHIAVQYRDGSYMIVRWDNGNDGGDAGWWLAEGSLFQDSDLLRWWPIPS